MPRLLFALLLLCSPVAASAQTIIGVATVVDGDTLSVSGQRIRIHGIDAPESQQSCQRGGAHWACGEEATRQLQVLIGNSIVRCEARDIDRYGRTVALCRAGTVDLGQAMVQAGLALAFTRYAMDYVGDEQQARAAQRGLWASDFTNPSAWRAERRSAGGGGDGPSGAPAASTAAVNRPVADAAHPTQAANGACLIKGNINRRGDHIYHMPGMPYYEATRAERMFCSEAEAQAAGFRRAIVR